MRNSWRQSLLQQARRFQAEFAPAYVKPHGGFYNDTAWSIQEVRNMSEIVAEVAPESRFIEEAWVETRAPGSILVEILGLNPALMGLPNTAHELTAKRAKSTFIREGFADRAYRPDGTLVPRTEPGAVLEDPEQIQRQVLRLAPVVDSICLHGDTPNCLELAELVKRTLVDNGYEVGY